MLNIGCNHQLVFNSHLFMLMPPYIYIPTNVFTIKSEQKNKNQRKCSFCLCFFNKYYVFCGIKYSIGKYQCVFPLAFNSKKIFKKFQYLYWTKNTFLMFLMENLYKKGNWNADQMEWKLCATCNLEVVDKISHDKIHY